MFITWTAAQTDKVLSTVLDLVKVAFGAFCGASLTYWQRHRDTRETRRHRLTQLILRVKVNPVANDIAGELIKLRNFFLDEAPELLLRSKKNQEFFRKWSNNPTISLLAETRASGFWTKEKIEELHRDLDALESSR
jgi:hypothetical protein